MNILGIKKRHLNKKGFLQISFAWLFAIIIGAIIIFFAIYASVRLMGTEGGISSTETGKEISVLLNPLETSFSEERTTPLSMSLESIILNDCESPEDVGQFGEQKISVSQKVSGRWTEIGIPAVSYNKYIFSNKSVQGRNFFLFSKPLNLPFKVADLIMLTSSKEIYCFVNAPESIEEELRNLNQANLLTQNCPQDSIKVCFDRSNDDCNIFVDTDEKTVETLDSRVYYEADALMFAAVFSDKETYECQLQRLMNRLEELALIYNEKGSILATKGCLAEIGVLGLSDAAASLQDSADLINIQAAADNAEDDNKRAYCPLW